MKYMTWVASTSHFSESKAPAIATKKGRRKKNGQSWFFLFIVTAEVRFRSMWSVSAPDKTNAFSELQFLVDSVHAFPPACRWLLLSSFVLREEELFACSFAFLCLQIPLAILFALACCVLAFFFQSGHRLQLGDSPLNRAELGNAVWAVLHSMAVNYPEKPSAAQQKHMTDFLWLFSEFYPCRWCTEHWRSCLFMFLHISLILIAHCCSSILLFPTWSFLSCCFSSLLPSFAFFRHDYQSSSESISCCFWSLDVSAPQWCEFAIRQTDVWLFDWSLWEKVETSSPRIIL